MHVEKPIKPGIDGIHTRDLISKPIFDIFRRLFILQMIGNPGLQNVILRERKTLFEKQMVITPIYFAGVLMGICKRYNSGLGPIGKEIEYFLERNTRKPIIVIIQRVIPRVVRRMIFFIFIFVFFLIM